MMKIFQKLVKIMKILQILLMRKETMEMNPKNILKNLYLILETLQTNQAAVLSSRKPKFSAKIVAFLTIGFHNLNGCTTVKVKTDYTVFIV